MLSLSNRRNRTTGHRAFTLVELLVVIAIIALLISILLPSLARAREQAKSAKCLANLKDMMTASTGYAMEDSSEYLIPVIPTLATTDYLSASRRGFGGKSGLHEFKGEFPEHPTWYGELFGMWSTKNGFGPGKRPLNRYLYSKSMNDLSYLEIEEMDLVEAEADEKLEFDTFKCPSDVGYQSGKDGTRDVIFGYGADPDDWREFTDPDPLFDAMGNSYATDSTLIVSLGGPCDGIVRSFGPYLRRYSAIPNTGRVVVYKEGNAFYTQFWNLQGAPRPSYSMGWHGILRQHNVAYADGHAKSAKYEVRSDVTGTSGTGTVTHSGTFTLRGGTVENMMYNSNADDECPYTFGLIGGFLVSGPWGTSHCAPAPYTYTPGLLWPPG